MNCKELLDTDRSRFDGRLKLSGGELHPDDNITSVITAAIGDKLDCVVETQ